MAQPEIAHTIPFNARLTVWKLHEDAVLPSRAYNRSAAYDLSAYVESGLTGHNKTVVIAPHSTALIGTGLGITPPAGHMLQVCSRSGLGLQSVFVANAPGIIDPDYIGEIKVLLFNGSHRPHYVKRGDRVAQVLILPYLTVPMIESKGPPTTETVRGDRGFGSTGK